MTDKAVVMVDILYTNDHPPAFTSGDFSQADVQTVGYPGQNSKLTVNTVANNFWKALYKVFFQFLHAIIAHTFTSVISERFWLKFSQLELRLISNYRIFPFKIIVRSKFVRK